MNKIEIIEKLKQSAVVTNIEELEYKTGFLVLRFFYDFDDTELDAAKAYANETSDKDIDEDKWYNEYYLPYLTDISVDEVSDMIAEITEESEIYSEYVNYALNRDDEGCEFITVFSEIKEKFDIDEILDTIGI